VAKNTFFGVSAAALTISALTGCAPRTTAVAPVPSRVDHIIVAIDSLERGIALLRELTGVTPVFGGVHTGRGTQNALLSFGAGRYLELLAPNPSDANGPAAVASFAKYRTLTPVSWAAYTPNADSLAAALVARGEAATEVRPGSRRLPDGRTLTWRTLAPWPGPRENLFPFFIQWELGPDHPSSTSPSGCRLEAMRFISQSPDSVSKRLRTADINVAVGRGPSDKLAIDLRCGSRTVTLPAR
jgi:hypothetical protein